MKVSVAALGLCLTVSSVAAFVPSSQRAFVPRPLKMSDDDESPSRASYSYAAAPAKPAASADVGGALVPIKEETVEFTAGMLGGVAGFALGGPVFGAIAAAAANYVSKTDGDVSDVVQAVSKTSLQVFNYLANLDRKYEILDKAKASLESSLDALKKREGVDPEIIKKVEDALATTTSKIKEVNDEYDLVGGGVTVLGVVGDLVEKAIKKATELNEEYQLTDKAMSSLKQAVNKAQTAVRDLQA